MPAPIRAIVTPAPKPFRYQRGWLGGWYVMEGEVLLAVTQEQTYAAAIVTALNICWALFRHLPLKLGAGSSNAVN